MANKDFKNAEGYSDPTAYYAIINVDGFKNTVDLNKFNYIKKKIKLLNEFLVVPTADEITHLLTLNGEYAIDKAVTKIILNHWKDE